MPGYDLAVLYTIGAHACPTLAQAITSGADTTGIGAAFAVNAILLSCREIRIYRALPYGPARADRLTALAVHHEHVRRLLRQDR